MLPKFHPFERKYVSVGAVWRHNAPHEATRATVFSSRPHTMRDAVITLLVPLEAATEPVQTATLGGGHRTRTLWQPLGAVTKPVKLLGAISTT